MEALPDDDRPPLKQLLAQAADLQQQYERDVEQAAAEHDRYDAAVNDLVECVRKHRAVIDDLTVDLGNDDLVTHWASDDRQFVLVLDPEKHVKRRIPLDAPGDR